MKPLFKPKDLPVLSTGVAQLESADYFCLLMNASSTAPAPAAVAAIDALQHDQEVAALVERERVRQVEGAELIASENYTSEAVMAAQGSILTNKYAEGLPRKRYYGGCEFVDQVEQLAIDRLCELFGAEWANVQPHSGASANSAVMLACLKPGDTILGFDLAHGGHLTHGSPVNYSGKLYRPTFYGVEKETGRIDMDKVEATAKKEKPQMIICGASAYAREWDYARFRAIADEVGAILLADISHPSGLIAAGLLDNPLPHCHVVTSTTHKTLARPTRWHHHDWQGLSQPMGLDHHERRRPQLQFSARQRRLPGHARWSS